MSSEARSILGDYDFFAKTIPGVLFFFGLVSLLPSIPNLPGETGFNLAFISVSIIVTAIGGFVVGQALHAVAVAGETAGYRFTLIVHDRFPALRTEERSPDENTGESDHGIFLRPVFFAWRLVNQVYCWIVKRLNEVVRPHRIWFKKRLHEEYQKEGDADGLYEWFKLESRDYLQKNTMELTEQHEKIYRFVMSYLEYADDGRARKFQATASFCRSTWVTLLLFSVIYAALIFPDISFLIGHTPIVSEVLTEYGVRVPFALFIGSLLFMYSTGQYKRHFTEYIVVDFYNVRKNGANT